MIVISILDEFINLSYSKNNIIQKEGDIYLGNYILLRMRKSSWCVHFLTSGSSLDIPISYISLFSELDVYHRGNIFSSSVVHNGKLEDFVYHMLSFVHFIQSKDFEKSIEHLDYVTKIGTKDFRDFIKQRIGMNFGEIYYNSINSSIYL
jgi:hypothetical protein